MKQITIYSVLILFIALFLFITDTCIDIERPLHNNTDTLKIIDTVYVQQEPEIITKYIDTPRYIYIDSTDTTSINILKDSLDRMEQFFSDVIDSLEHGKVYTLSDTTTFETKDSIITVAEFWPYNRISYHFFPHIDTTFIGIPAGYVKPPKFRIGGGGSINIGLQPFIQAEILVMNRRNLILSLKANTNNSYGIGIYKMYDFHGINIKELLLGR